MTGSTKIRYRPPNVFDYLPANYRSYYYYYYGNRLPDNNNLEGFEQKSFEKTAAMMTITIYPSGDRSVGGPAAFWRRFRRRMTENDINRIIVSDRVVSARAINNWMAEAEHNTTTTSLIRVSYGGGGEEPTAIFHLFYQKSFFFA